MIASNLLCFFFVEQEYTVSRFGLKKTDEKSGGGEEKILHRNSIRGLCDNTSQDNALGENDV